MHQAYRFGLCLIAWLPCACAFCAEADSSFELRNVNKWGCELVNGPLRVKCLYFGFSIETPAGRLAAQSRESGQQLADIIIEKNTTDIKRVKLVSEAFSRKASKLRYYAAFEARRGFPFIFVEWGLENLGDNEIAEYEFLRLFPMPSEYYISDAGMAKVNADLIETGNWIYFPAENRTDGIGLVFNAKRKGLKFGTTYPKGDWKSAGYYFMRDLNKIPKGQANKINFVVFPANGGGEAEACYNLLKDKNLFLELWE
jgi:hypothetical protein